MTIGGLQQFNNYTCDTITTCGLFKIARISNNVDVFAKTFYATILADLGQKADIHIQPGVNGIDYLISALGNVSESAGGSENTTFLGYPSDSAWASLQSIIPLIVNAATIYAEYACMIPKIKNTPSLLISLFIADFVLLQATWAVAKWVISRVLEARDPQMHYCLGCVNSGREDIPLVTKPTYSRLI